MAEFDEGVDAYLSQDYATALEIWQPLAEDGDAAAQFNLGVMYANGEGVTQSHAKAIDLFRASAQNGLIAAQLYLGRIYDDGDLVGLSDPVE